jgi:hypothetical protein
VPEEWEWTRVPLGILRGELEVDPEPEEALRSPSFGREEGVGRTDLPGDLHPLFGGGRFDPVRPEHQNPLRERGGGHRHHHRLGYKPGRGEGNPIAVLIVDPRELPLGNPLKELGKERGGRRGKGGMILFRIF